MACGVRFEGPPQVWSIHDALGAGERFESSWFIPGSAESFASRAVPISCVLCGVPCRGLLPPQPPPSCNPRGVSVTPYHRSPAPRRKTTCFIPEWYLADLEAIVV